MAVPQPKIIYEGQEGDRDQYLNFAEDTAALTLPSMDPRGMKRSARHDRPHTTEGTTAVFSMSSQALKILMPPGVLYGDLDMPPYLWKFIEQQALGGEVQFSIEDVRELKDRLKLRSFEIVKSLNQRNIRSRFGAAIRRNLVEGSTAIHNAPPPEGSDPVARMRRKEGLRIFPLRSHVVVRDPFGNVRQLVLMEELEPDVMMIQKRGDFGNILKIWTLIDYDSDMIWRQVGDRGEPFVVEDETTDGYFVMTSEMPDIDNYAHPYFWNYLRLIAQIDHAEASLAEAQADASWSPIGIREGSSLAEDPEQVTERRTGEPIVGQEGDIWYPNAGRKIADWAWVLQMRNDDKRELDNIAAKGIKDRAVSEASATAVLEIIEELETQTQDLLSSYEDTGQRPLMASEAAIHDRFIPLLKPGTEEELLKEFVEISITTGVSALSKQRSMIRFVTQGLAALQKLDPTLIVHGEEAADRLGEGMMIETEGLYSTAPPQQQPGVNGTGAETGDLPREETIMTAGGPQPPQPPQGPPPVR